LPNEPPVALRGKRRESSDPPGYGFPTEISPRQTKESMKKIIATLSLLALMLGSVATSAQNPPAENKPAAETKETTKKSKKKEEKKEEKESQKEDEKAAKKKSKKKSKKEVKKEDKKAETKPANE
jgi:hypothetical protein